MKVVILVALIMVISWLVLKALVSSREKPFDHAQPDEIEEENIEPSDAWEGSFWEVDAPRHVSAELRLSYVDGSGEASDRDFNLKKYGAWEGGALLIGHCRLRNATRTFRSDRVVRCTDLETGEVIEDLPQWLDARWNALPERAIDHVIENYWDALRVMFYVSKADGRLTQGERAVLRTAVRDLGERDDLPDGAIDTVLGGMDVPSLAAFKNAFGRLVKNRPETAQRVLDWCEQTVATEKTVAAGEQDALDYMIRRLKKA